MENDVDIVTVLGYWHLHRVVDGRHFFGFSDHRIGLSIREESKEILKDCTSQPTDEPYTKDQIESFGRLSLEELERWVKRGT